LRALGRLQEGPSKFRQSESGSGRALDSDLELQTLHVDLRCYRFESRTQAADFGSAGGSTVRVVPDLRGGFKSSKWKRIGTAQRSHRLCNHLERPRRQRGKCHGQLRAAVGSVVCWCTPLAREHHGDEHLKPLHTPRYRLRPLLRPCACAIGCSHATGSVGAATRAWARHADSTALASSGVLYAYALVQCACAAAARRGWRQHTSARTAHSCAANREKKPSPRRCACGIGRAIDGVFCKGQSQANKQNTQTNKQTA
jgi:hypothetical protein